MSVRSKQTFIIALERIKNFLRRLDHRKLTDFYLRQGKIVLYRHPRKNLSQISQRYSVLSLSLVLSLQIYSRLTIATFPGSTSLWMTQIEVAVRQNQR